MNPGYSMTLDDLKDWNKKLITEIREIHINGGFTFSGKEYDSDERSRSNIAGACTLSLVLLGQGLNFPDGFTWRASDNTNTPMKAADIIGLALTAGTFVTTCYSVSWYHKGNIDAITDIDTMLNYDVNVGWPA